jgi:predicted anti-sigma-YlaC factor YlaD
MRRTSGEITCQELVELVTAYLDNALSLFEQQRFEEHLTRCRGCQAYLEQMRQTIRLTGTIEEDEVPPDVRDKLLEAFRNWKVSG